MKMRESDQQAKFSYLACLLGVWAYENGYKLTDGDAYRDIRWAGKFGESGCGGYGKKKSLHKKRRARDMNLFLGAERNDDGWLQGGQYAADTEAFREIGRKWESLDPECRWGGRFKDGNHMSLVTGYDNTKAKTI